MKIKIVLNVAVVTLSLMVSAHAETFYPNGFYVGIGGIYSDINFTASASYAGTTLGTTSLNKNIPGAYADIGYMLASLPLQFDISASDSVFSNDDGEPYTGSDYLKEGFFNMTVNGDFGWPVIPFVTAGFGITNAGYTGSTNSWNTAWQAGAGAHIRATDNILIDAGLNYQYIFNSNNQTQGITYAEKDTATQFRLGVTYVFGDQHIPPSLISD